MSNRALPLVLASLTLAACPAITPCPDGPALPQLAACVIPAAGWTDNPQNSEPLDISVSGTVDDVGVGAVPGECFASSGAHVGAYTPDETNAVWARVTDDVSNEEWIVAFVAPGHAGLELMPTDSLSFEYEYMFGGFSPDRGQLTVRDATGDLVAWIGAAGSAESLSQPTEISVAQGPARCSESDSCGSWSQYHLDVLMPGMSESEIVDYGATSGADAGSDFTFHHGGYAQDTQTSSNCADWFVGDLDAALISNRGLV